MLLNSIDETVSAFSFLLGYELGNWKLRLELEDFRSHSFLDYAFHDTEILSLHEFVFHLAFHTDQEILRYFSNEFRICRFNSLVDDRKMFLQNEGGNFLSLCT